MKKVFITGSTDGLGFMAAEQLLQLGHQVLLHARNEEKAAAALKQLPGAAGAVVGDLASLAQTTALADAVNAYGPFDSIIHNAAVGYQEPHRRTADGLPHVFAINSLAPYLLTALIRPPQRLIYTSSGLHEQGSPDLHDLLWEQRRWNSLQAYADTKLHNILLAFAVARRWPAVLTNVVTPGWVATKMGGPSAPDSLEQAPKTQVWLAASDANEVQVTGKFFYHQQVKLYLPAADNVDRQEEFVDRCAALTGVALPT